jgi:hypothetical protein
MTLKRLLALCEQKDENSTTSLSSIQARLFYTPEEHCFIASNLFRSDLQNSAGKCSGAGFD